MKKYIADPHFNHANILRLDGRNFPDVETMNKEMIRLWNENVSLKDDIYLVGDICMKNRASEDGCMDIEEILKKLRGKIHLVLGNHDSFLFKGENKYRLGKYFESIQERKSLSDYLGPDLVQVYIDHYPSIDYPGMYRGGYHIHGHIHNSKNRTYEVLKEYPQIMNAAASILDYIPRSLTELQEINNIWYERK